VSVYDDCILYCSQSAFSWELGGCLSILTGKDKFDGWSTELSGV